MRVVRGFSGLDLDLRRPAVTIGNFDGVHRGHQRVMRHAVQAALGRAAAAVVCTFDPHTARVLHPANAPRMLQTIDQRLAQIARIGVDVTVVIPFDAATAATGRRHYVDEFLRGELDVGSLHVSKGFSFGRDASGRTRYLEARGAEDGFSVDRVDACTVEGRAVSSTRIRKLVADGHVEEAESLLGRPYSIVGKVTAGTGRGRDLGARTANVLSANEILPQRGVYSGFASLPDGEFPAVVNIGQRPTFGHDTVLHVEAHLLDFEADIYGHSLEIGFVARLREELRFGGPEELAAQIVRDIEQARAQLAARS